MIKYIFQRKIPHHNIINIHDVLRKQCNIVAIEELCGTKGLSTTKTLGQAFSVDSEEKIFKVCERTA